MHIAVLSSLCSCMVNKYHSVAQGCSYVTNHSESVDLQVVYPTFILIYDTVNSTKSMNGTE